MCIYLKSCEIQEAFFNPFKKMASSRMQQCIQIEESCENGGLVKNLSY